MNHATPTSEACHTYEGGMSHLHIKHAAHTIIAPPHNPRAPSTLKRGCGGMIMIGVTRFFHDLVSAWVDAPNRHVFGFGLKYLIFCVVLWCVFFCVCFADVLLCFVFCGCFVVFCDLLCFAGLGLQYPFVLHRIQTTRLARVSYMCICLYVYVFTRICM